MARPRLSPMQAKHKDQDSELATKYSCPECRISYYSQAARCPLCDAYKQLDEMRQALREISSRFEATQNLNEKLKTQVDSSVAIRNATDLLDDNDLAFFKLALYQWKINRSIKLKLTHAGTLDLGVKQRRQDLSPNGFLLVPEDGEPSAHVCTSMGGLAIAEYYEEALHTIGSAGAMNVLLRGFAKLLPGATS